MNRTNQTLDKVLRIKRLTEKTGFSRSSTYNKTNPASKYFDPSFPKPIRLGARSVGWLESEVDAWIASRAESRGVAQ
ncbi:helix-turn-helix transcriptional regulator [Burkholderia stagnalis]|uniref:helix-turn-helix transcriptional regulator n=1 Tax=Burkholderia stagnalis TaxID=1503054 RepID=UPI000F5EA738|nr:AlpA family transcriptional regulator [Burkholderia stagnalis]EMD9442900.1 AlpA family transcriptional regulator [Burkholderia cepacia]RQY86016.1 AlpA family transcriptional regulator [Burkholderia stagnalis]